MLFCRGSNPVRISAPPELAGMTLESRLVSYDWDNQFQSFQEATMKGSFKPLCWTSQSTLLPVSVSDFLNQGVESDQNCVTNRRQSAPGKTKGFTAEGIR